MGLAASLQCEAHPARRVLHLANLAAVEESDVVGASILLRDHEFDQVC